MEEKVKMSECAETSFTVVEKEIPIEMENSIDMTKIYSNKKRHVHIDGCIKLKHAQGVLLLKGNRFYGTSPVLNYLKVNGTLIVETLHTIYSTIF